MAPKGAFTVENAIIQAGLVPLFYQPDPAIVIDAVGACVAGGAQVVEFTDRGPGAHRVFRTAIEVLRQQSVPPVLGVGSIVDPATAALYIANGADFVVGPYFRPDVASVCHRRGIPYIPGAATPWEISQAEAHGATIVKVFPARLLRPQFIADVLGPSPHSRLIPTGGVPATREGVSEWIRAGAVAVGIGSQLVPSHPTRPVDLATLTERVAEALSWIAEARSEANRERVVS